MEIRDADPGYVQEQVGAALYVHLRAVPAIVDFRRAALVRSQTLHAECDRDDEGRRGALGLLVLQRAMLAVEDADCFARSTSRRRSNASSPTASRTSRRCSPACSPTQS